ncbi:glycosyltransferase [Candidatus Aminicenantes bacterium AH-873-B07]|nr:glycosyltransferase [Candidatus Aminicenantes bacterium AH-873-B07]
MSRSSIIISAPFKNKNIQEVENLLFQQIKNLYGLEHVQLFEHKKYGLPEIEFVSEILRKYTKSGVNFSYGSLFNWLFLQTVKYCFMFKRNSERIHTLLDKMILSHNFSSEFKPPFSRNFWIYSKNISQKELERGIEIIKNNLKEKIEFNFSDLIELNKEIVNFYIEDTVSSVVVTQGEKRNLQECLNHLLTQRVDFNLEVCVWDIKDNHEVQEIIEKNYPGVKYFTTKRNEKTLNALFKIVNKLKGNYILLVSNDIILPLDSVKNFYSILKNSPDISLLSPKILEKEKINHVFFGKRNSLKKLFAGRMHKFFKSVKSQKIDWVFSECLFFRKEALFDRKFKNNIPTKRNIFLWEKIRSSKKNFLYFPEITVYKQG